MLLLGATSVTKAKSESRSSLPKRLLSFCWFDSGIHFTEISAKSRSIWNQIQKLETDLILWGTIWEAEYVGQLPRVNAEINISSTVYHQWFVQDLWIQGTVFRCTCRYLWYVQWTIPWKMSEGPPIERWWSWSYKHGARLLWKSLVLSRVSALRQLQNR